MSTANYAWVITHDYGDHDLTPSRVGVLGPRNASGRLVAIMETAGPAVRAFRMLTDDDEPCFEGLFTSSDLIDEPDSELGEEAFGPLDDLGTPDAGCTTIEYRYDGRWTQL